IAGYSIGANEGFIYCRAEYALAIHPTVITFASIFLISNSSNIACITSLAI
ncbi:unnamed protein product, partial [marine sediment metagenome]